MPAIDSWIHQPAAQAVGWALLQFVWQGAAVGALTALALVALKRGASDIRYVVSAIGLALMLTLPIVTGVQKYQTLRASAQTPDAKGTVFQDGVIVFEGFRAKFDRLEVLEPSASAPPRAAGAPEPSGIVGRIRALRLEGFLPLLMPLWLAGVSLLSLRLFTGWLWVQGLRTRGVSPAGEALLVMTVRLSRRLHIRRAVTLLESRLVEVPTVIGFLKPVILLPASALAALAPHQIEAILAHELAHIRRHDYLVNLLQTLVETVLFYHPAVWWLSRRIRIERENCCDDLAVSLCGDPVAYATALADLEALRTSGPTPERHIAMAATGGVLLQRVRRLLGAPASHSGRGPAWLAATAALTLIGCVAYTAENQRPAGDQRLTQAVEFNKRELRELGRAVRAEIRPPIRAAARAFRDEVRAMRPSIRAAAVAMRQIVGGAAKPVVAVSERRAQVAAASMLAVPAIAEAPSPAAALLAESPSDLSVPAAPAPPLPAEPAVAAATQSVSISKTDDSSGSWSFSTNGDKLEVSYRGKVEFSDDDTDIRTMSAGAYLKISDGKWLGRHSVEVRERGGQIERLYYVNGSLRPFEPEGRMWLQQNMPRFIRSTGIGADARVARLLKNGGPAAVLGEIGRIESSYAKGISSRQLFKQAPLTPDQYRQVLGQASREMTSSYDLAQLLITVADQLPADDQSRLAFFQAARSISSSYDQRRVLTAMLKRGPMSPEVLGALLVAAGSIDSNYDLAEVLKLVVSQQPLDARNRTAFFSTLGKIDSSYDRKRVLSDVVSNQRPTDPAVLESALIAAAAIDSNYEVAQFLLEVLRHNAVEGTVRAPFFTAVETIDGSHDRGRVLQGVVRKTGVSADTMRAVLRSASRLDGYELSQLLQAVAANYVVAGDVRDAYLAAADRLGNYEQGQVMAALVRSERRK